MKQFLKNIDKSDLIFCFALVVLGLFWQNAFRIRLWRLDDSFFGYTYAKNLANGNGFTFNGMKVIGTSAPLPVLIYSAIAKILRSDNIKTIAENVGVFAFILSSIFLYIWVAGLTKLRLAGFFAALSYYLNIFILCIFGHETILALLLIIISLVLNLKKRHVSGYFVLGLAFLCRAESVFVLLYMAFQTLKDKPLRKGNIPFYVKCAICFSIPLIVWYSFSFFYFGQLFSNSYKFKVLQSTLSGAFFLRDLTNFERSFFMANNNRYLDLVCTIGVSAIGLFGILKSADYLFLMLSLGVAPMVFYTSINITFYHWFLFLFGFMVSIFIGVSIKVVSEYYRGENLRARISKNTLYLILGFLAFYPSYKLGRRDIPNSGDTPYQKIGQYLKENTPQNASVGYVEVGQIAYYSQRKIIDLTGMVTKGVVEHLKTKDFNWTYEEYKPDYIVDYPPFAWLFDFSKSRIKKNYSMIHTFDFGSGYILYLYKNNHSEEAEK